MSSKIVTLKTPWYFSKQEISLEKIDLSLMSTVEIPHTWNNIDGQDGGMDYYRGTCWYYHPFNVACKKGRQVIFFEGVNSIARVYVNQTFIGEHQGGYSAFSFDLTEVVSEGMNDLVVSVDNTHHDTVFPLYADFTFYGGIYRPVSLISLHDVSFDRIVYGAKGIYIHQKEISKERALLDIEMNLINHSNQSQYNLKLWISDQKQQIVFQKEKSIEIKDRLTSHFMVEMDHPHLWQGTEDPYQYTFNIQILDEKQVLDEEKIEMGLRSFRIDDTYLYLNEKPIRLHGVSRHQDLEGIGNALSDEMHDQDLELIEEIGANAIRLAHYQQADYFYLRCNQKGLIVWAEIPYITVPSKTDFSGDNAKSQLTELIMQNYNHTSILMWGVQNEITAVGKKYQVERIIHELHQLAKKLDPYRLTAQAQLANLEVDDSLNQITDVSGFNLYYGWYFGEVEGFEQWLNAYRMKNPKRPVCISEYGVEGIISYHSEHPKIKDYSEEYHASWHENAYRIFETKPYLWGSFVWNMFDFGSDGRDEGGIKGRNNKGLVTFDRMIKKDAFYFYKAKWSKTPVLHLTSKRFSERTEKTVSIKAYSNLKSISFYHQDQLIGTITSDDVVFEMKVHLHHGKNQIDVRSNQFYDSLTLFKVNHSHVRYKPPVADEKNVINWFNQVIKIHSS